jgi:hypothetical protein
MRFLAAFAPLLLSTTVTAGSWFGNEQVALVDNPLSVPGKNPLTYCTQPDDYILDIDHVDLTPNPPEA